MFLFECEPHRRSAKGKNREPGPEARVGKYFYILIAFSGFVKENAAKNRRQLGKLTRFFNKVFYKNAKPFGSHFFGQLLSFFAR